MRSKVCAILYTRGICQLAAALLDSLIRDSSSSRYELRLSSALPASHGVLHCRVVCTAAPLVFCLGRCLVLRSRGVCVVSLRVVISESSLRCDVIFPLGGGRSS